MKSELSSQTADLELLRALLDADSIGVRTIVNSHEMDGDRRRRISLFSTRIERVEMVAAACDLSSGLHFPQSCQSKSLCMPIRGSWPSLGYSKQERRLKRPRPVRIHELEVETIQRDINTSYS